VNRRHGINSIPKSSFESISEYIYGQLNCTQLNEALE
jgi:hypothetical protein